MVERPELICNNFYLEESKINISFLGPYVYSRQLTTLIDCIDRGRELPTSSLEGDQFKWLCDIDSFSEPVGTFYVVLPNEEGITAITYKGIHPNSLRPCDAQMWWREKGSLHGIHIKYSNANLENQSPIIGFYAPFKANSKDDLKLSIIGNGENWFNVHNKFWNFPRSPWNYRAHFQGSSLPLFQTRQAFDAQLTNHKFDFIQSWEAGYSTI